MTASLHPSCNRLSYASARSCPECSGWPTRSRGPIESMDRKDLKTEILEFLPHFRALGYLAACVLIAVAAWQFWSQSLHSTIVIEAGPKGGFFNDAANLLQNELQRYDIGSVLINRNDTLKILEDVNDEKSSVAVGFMAQDLGNRKYPGGDGSRNNCPGAVVHFLFGIT